MRNKSLEQYLKDLRKSCNYSQEFVASHLNITRQTYSHYETGRITPPVNSLYNLAKLYGIPVENLLDLVVTYNINMDFARNPQASKNDMTDELSLFIDFINAPENSKKFKFLNKRERLLLFYFLLLDARDQEDILSFMKVKYLNRSNDKQYYDDKQPADNNE
ncbi:MAG: helix-turn-helix transcriptional regulator [Bacillota bacterium]|nr:helix-turn-helix transcriptional regulator [Bacillota bacterium]